MANRPKTYKNFVAPESGKSYQISANPDGSSKIVDVTDYIEQGDTWGAVDANEVWDALENSVSKAGDNMTGNLYIDKNSPTIGLADKTNGYNGCVVLTQVGHLALYNDTEPMTTNVAKNGKCLRLRAGNELTSNALQLAAYKDGVETLANVLGTHNKPSGSYTGNGSTTSRKIDLGISGESAYQNNSCIKIANSNGFAIVGNSGAIVKLGTSVTGLSGTVCNFKMGVLTIATDNTVVNGNGITHYYEVL